MSTRAQASVVHVPSLLGHAKADREHLNTLSKGFEILALAATFVCAIQAQVMTTTIGIPALQETAATRTINALHLSGLILDLMSAVLAFLTSRWLQRLSDDEKDYLEVEFSSRQIELDATEGRFPAPLGNTKSTGTQGHISVFQEALCAWLGLSLFVPMPLLVFGVLCMFLGIYTYTWTQHSTIVASLVTFAGVVTLPFLLGVFMIGRGKVRRRMLIQRLSRMQGDW